MSDGSWYVFESDTRNDTQQSAVELEVLLEGDGWVVKAPGLRRRTGEGSHAMGEDLYTVFEGGRLGMDTNRTAYFGVP